MKNKGGRGKSNDFSTVVMRIPKPLRLKVEEIISEFYETQKPVTGIESYVQDSLSKPVTGIEVSEDSEINKPVTGIEVSEDSEINKPVTGIETLNLKKRAYMTIKRAQINTVEELRTEALAGTLKSIKNLGDTSIREIYSKLGINPIQTR